MRILLDTHIFLWFISGDTQLSTDVWDAIRDPDNEIYLSAIYIKLPVLPLMKLVWFNWLNLRSA
jgi:hypothetical protein